MIPITKMSLFGDLITYPMFEMAVEECFSRPSVGKDGTTPKEFARNKAKEFEIIKRKLANKSYVFTPYLELLIPKTFDARPRRLAIPTFRDKVLLHILKKYISAHFSEYANMPHQLAIIDRIKRSIWRYKYYVKYDISEFYDSIPHDKLIDILKTRIKDDYAIYLIKMAINNHIDPKHSRESREFRATGVPQGLSVSNILANIYGGLLDAEMRDVYFFRYVDDMLLLCESTEEAEYYKNHLIEFIASLGLKNNEQKMDIGSIDNGFDFLGYSFDGKEWLIKKQPLEKQFRAIRALFTRYEKEIRDPRNRYRKGWQEIAYAKLVDDLNTQIAGAVFRGKKLGFTFYFSKITSLSQLHQLDAFVQQNISDLNLVTIKKHTIKSHVRAYYAWRSDDIEAYILNYDIQLSSEEKFTYLENRDIVKGSASTYSKSYINSLYERYIRTKLRRISDFKGNLS